MWQDLFAALALVLVIEGLVPFINPKSARRIYSKITQMSDSTLRFAGLTGMILGLILLNIVK